MASRGTGVGPPQALTSAACDERASEFNARCTVAQMIQEWAICFGLGAVIGTAATLLALRLYDHG
jgi:hypothetical protein